MVYEELELDEYDRMKPHLVDQMIRQALRMCWQFLPPERQNIDEVERQFKRVADRAIRDMKDDDSEFRGDGA